MNSFLYFWHSRNRKWLSIIWSIIMSRPKWGNQLMVFGRFRMPRNVTHPVVSSSLHFQQPYLKTALWNDKESTHVFGFYSTQSTSPSVDFLAIVLGQSDVLIHFAGTNGQDPGLDRRPADLLTPYGSGGEDLVLDVCASFQDAVIARGVEQPVNREPHLQSTQRPAAERKCSAPP